MIRVATRFAPAIKLRPLAVIRTWFSLASQRQNLSELDTNMLKDIGITPDQARSEAQRPFWDAPDHWSK